MAKWEINKLFKLGPNHYLPCGLNLLEKAWWRFMPGVVINVKWPVGEITVDENDPRWDWTLGASLQSGTSADPNDHYRPWMEQHVGRQGWDWNWGMANNDVSANRLTIKIRRKHSYYATIAALRWA